MNYENMDKETLIKILRHKYSMLNKLYLEKEKLNLIRWRNKRMYCRQCGKELNNDKAVICIHCGTNRGQGNNYCQDCGAEVRSKEADVCLNCGVRLKASKINMSASFKNANGTGKPIGNSKIVAGILAIVLGAIGIHKFYLGYKEKGFIQLAIFLVAIFIFQPIVLVNNIWSIIDAINIFRGKMNTSTGEELV